MAALRFEPEWRITLFTLIMVPLMVSLGFWQLDRSEEKAILAADFERKQAQAPAPLLDVFDADASELAYLPVRFSGRYRPGQYFLLDNRMHEGTFGNEVLAVFELAGSDRLVLVNRGWIAADPARLRQPEVPVAEADGELAAHVYVSPGDPYLLQEQVLAEGWPKQLQAVDMEKVSAALDGAELFPYPVRIDAGQAGALTVDWKIINVSPEKHTGYAVQWFTMAIVLAIIYLLRCSNLWQLLRGIEHEA